MSVFKRTAIVGSGLLFTGLLAACSGGGEPGGTGTPAPPEVKPVTGPKINDPKDAAAVEICNLLPSGAATSMGLEPTGKIRTNQIDPEAPPSCSWTSSDTSLNVGMTALSDRSIQEYYDHKADYVDYAELDIAGHPAVRVNKGDPKQDGFCNIYVATKDGQVLSAVSHDSSMADPCGLAQKALEASVPTLPAAK
ncbi:DUF3558 domain-containing protein [Saccharopolyspora erythraea]|uniref:DUF3558 domain-containing protein n=1 Tax=Saccharopolyspora erythraea TaxID=1836 RepID=UPI001BAE2D3D|nr:DUF3558 domain-containing protein [Saccharopolyspora erythraea]QUH00392.1 DUF3558 domain-containing protein [Saccharopolyspora erythraea]